MAIFEALTFVVADTCRAHPSLYYPLLGKGRGEATHVLKGSEIKWEDRIARVRRAAINNTFEV